MKDFSGTEVAPVLAADRPRHRQWCKFNLIDAEKQKALIDAGAHAAPDGKLVAIFQASQTTPTVEVNGQKQGGELLPEYFQLVTPAGHNLTAPQHDPKTGHGSFADIVFFPQSPMVKDLAPCDSVGDLPPHRVMDSRWLEGLHGKAIPAEAHEAANGEMTPAKFLQHAGA